LYANTGPSAWNRPSTAARPRLSFGTRAVAGRTDRELQFTCIARAGPCTPMHADLSHDASPSPTESTASFRTHI